MRRTLSEQQIARHSNARTSIQIGHHFGYARSIVVEKSPFREFARLRQTGRPPVLASGWVHGMRGFQASMHQRIAACRTTMRLQLQRTSSPV
jgi:hypothetical protein